MTSMILRKRRRRRRRKRQAGAGVESPPLKAGGSAGQRNEGDGKGNEGYPTTSGGIYKML